MPAPELARRSLLRLSLAGLLAVPVLIQAEAPAAAAMEASSPIPVIQQLDQSLLAVMQAGTRTSFVQRFNMLAPAVERAFDLPTILQTSVGLGWNNIPAGQRAQLEQVFRRYTVATYVSNFDSYNGQKLEILPATRPLPNGDQVVQTKIIRASGNPVEIDYVMRPEAGGWKVVDVLAEGSISRVAVLRSDFRRLVAGGNASALVATLEQKVSLLSGGALA